MNFESLEPFQPEIVKNSDSSIEKFRVEPHKICELLSFVKNNAEFDFDMLRSIIAVDLGVESNQFELVYDLYSSKLNSSISVSVLIERKSPTVASVVSIFKSAYFDECEIFDLFGINFTNNPDLKRLLMPKGWVGHPLRKDYVKNNPKLSWNSLEEASGGDGD